MLREMLAFAFAFADSMEDRIESHWDEYLPTGHRNAAVRLVAGQTRTVLTVVTLGLVIILGVLVYSEVEGALPAPSNTDLSNASSNATADFADSMELAPVIMIVLIAAVVLGVVQRFRS